MAKNRAWGRLALVAAALLAGAGGCAHSPQSGRKVVRLKDAERDATPTPVVIARMRDRAAGTLRELARSDDPRLRMTAMQGAGLLPSGAEDVLVSGLADENVAVRTTAAMSAGKLGLRQLSPRVQRLLADESPYVQAAAIFGLSKLGEPVDPTPLGTIVLSDTSIKVRSHAAVVLGEMGDASAMPLLRSAARSRPARASVAEMNLFHLQIGEALVKLGDESQLEPIRAALYPARPEDLEATALAVQILGQVQDKGAIDQLIYLSAKSGRGGQMPAEVRLAAAGSLARMGLRQGSFIADEYAANPAPAIRAQAAFVYGETGKPGNLVILEPMLSDPDRSVRAAAAVSVLKIADEATRSAGIP